MKRPKDFDILQNTFILNQNHYKAVMGKYIKSKNFAWALVVVLTVLVVLMGIVMFQMARQPNTVAMIFRNDGNGLVYMGTPKTAYQINDVAVVENYLVGYIVNLYSVPVDIDTRKQHIANVTAMTEEKYMTSYVRNILRDEYTKYNDGNSVHVVINSVSRTPKGLWSVSFQQVLNDKVIATYTCTLTVKQNVVDGTNVYNPLGLFVVDIDNVERIL